MKTIDIILLEDNPIDKIKLEIHLSESISRKYSFNLIATFQDINELKNFMDTNPVDLIISDIYLKGKTIGLELLKKLKNSDIPIILVTQSTENELFLQAKALKNVHYLIKPFHQLTIQSTIEKAYEEFQLLGANKEKNYLFVKIKTGHNEKIPFSSIIYLESDGNYSFIYTKDKRFVLKKSLIRVLEQDLDDNFFKIHQKFAVNKNFISGMKNAEILLLGDVELPIGKNYKKQIMEIIQ